MSNNLVIVAIPAQDESVWKVSSEKIPHLTLLFLGDAEKNQNVARIMEFVQHATNIAERGSFMLEVDRRDTLGEDKADVLVFRKDWSLKWIEQFRAQLLQDNDIRAAYESTEQFPEWLPHLTLGYPETPAHEDKIPEHGIRWISFDRIAVWTGNYEGPQFRLEYPERYSDDTELARWSGMGEDFVEHFGVKGMRWGVRNDKDTSVTVNGKTKMVTAKKADKLDTKWEKNQFTLPKGIERHNATAEYVNSRLGTLNDKYKDDDFSKEHFDIPSRWSPRYKQYAKEYNNLVEAGFRQAVKDVHGVSPTGKKQAEVEVQGDRLQLVVKDVEVKHANDKTVEVFLFEITRDANGKITRLNQLGDSMEQTAELGAEFLEHFGVKGMRWGVRNDRHGRNRWSPKDHTLKGDVVRAVVLPPGASLPAEVRLVQRGAAEVKKSTPAIKSGLKKTGRGAGKVMMFLADSSWETSTYSSEKQAVVHNRVAKEIDEKIYRLQTAPKYAGKNLKADKRLADEYEQDVAKVTDAAYRRAVKSVYGENYSGTKEARYVNDARGARIEVRNKATGERASEALLNRVEDDIEHAATKELVPDITLPVKLDPNGQIVGVDLVVIFDEEDSMKQTVALGAEFLEHYGVKGMRWGVRNRPSPVAVTPSATSVVPRGTKRQTKIKTEGGENHPATSDAIKAAEAKAKLRRSGTAALSNKELRELQERLNLERNVTNLAGTQSTFAKGRTFVKGLTGIGKEVNDAGNTFLNTKRLVNQNR